LTIKGERKTEHQDKKENYHRIERSYGSFKRIFRVSEGVNEKDIKAKYNDGVLELSISAPKKEKPKTIELKVE
jgi:HSP20 family protein